MALTTTNDDCMTAGMALSPPWPEADLADGRVLLEGFGSWTDVSEGVIRGARLYEDAPYRTDAGDEVSADVPRHVCVCVCVCHVLPYNSSHHLTKRDELGGLNPAMTLVGKGLSLRTLRIVHLVGTKLNHLPCP